MQIKYIIGLFILISSLSCFAYDRPTYERVTNDGLLTKGNVVFIIQGANTENPKDIPILTTNEAKLLVDSFHKHHYKTILTDDFIHRYIDGIDTTYIGVKLNYSK